MASAYHDIITMRQPDNESPTAFGLRVKTQCDRLDGLFHAQDVKDVFINGLSEIVQSHVWLLDGQFPKRTLADTISAAQMYWDGTNKLRLSLELPRLQTTKVAYASPMPTRHTNVDRFFPVTQLRARSRSPPPKESPQSRTDICYNCKKPGHFAAQCAEPYRPRECRPSVIAVNTVSEDTKMCDLPIREHACGCARTCRSCCGPASFITRPGRASSSRQGPSRRASGSFAGRAD